MTAQAHHPPEYLIPQTCDRCYKQVGVTVPWTKDLTTGRVLWRACLDCEAEMKPPCGYCGGKGYYTGGDEQHVCWCQK